MHQVLPNKDVQDQVHPYPSRNVYIWKSLCNYFLFLWSREIGYCLFILSNWRIYGYVWQFIWIEFHFFFCVFLDANDQSCVCRREKWL